MNLERPLQFKVNNLQLFAEDNPPADPQSAEEYAAAIKDLKEKTVPKEVFEQLQQDKATLIRALAEGSPLPENAQQEEKPNIKELRQTILNAGENNLSNAEFVKAALDLRKASIAEGYPDPFLPLGIKNKPTNEDLAGAEKVAEVFQAMLDEATDPETGKLDNEIFNALLKKNIANDNPLLSAKLRNSRK